MKNAMIETIVYMSDDVSIVLQYTEGCKTESALLRVVDNNGEDFLVETKVNGGVLATLNKQIRRVCQDLNVI
tara:strand:- start:29 stop:244 length:216 start_codon:yes stop_codon:yes gene_type:complete